MCYDVEKGGVMPDGDIFSRSLSRNWARPARLWFGGADDEVAVAKIVKALTKDLHNRPWIDIQGPVSIIADTMQRGCDEIRRRRTLKDLERYRDLWPADRYDAMRRVANRMLVDTPLVELAKSPQAVVQSLESQIAANILAESTTMHVAPASEAARLAQATKMDIAAFNERTVQLGLRLRADPAIFILTSQLLQPFAEPGQVIRAPRRQNIRRTQLDLVDLPIG
jgi:hypothetical protein